MSETHGPAAGRTPDRRPGDRRLRGGHGPAPSNAQEQQVEAAIPTVFWLDIGENAVYRATAPEFEARRIVTGTDPGPDGVAVDVATGALTWTSMGLAWADSYRPGHPGGTCSRRRSTARG